MAWRGGSSVHGGQLIEAGDVLISSPLENWADRDTLDSRFSEFTESIRSEIMFVWRSCEAEPENTSENETK
jgi:hypothetical protein